MSVGLQAQAKVEIDGDKMVIAHEGNIGRTLEAAHAYRAAEPKTGRFRGDLKMTALIPPVLVVELLNRGINVLRMDERDQIELRKLLNGEFAYLKTTNARA